MKKITVILISILFFFSCNQEETTNLATVSVDNQQEYIGKLHNSALGFVFSNDLHYANNEELFNKVSVFVSEQPEMEGQATTVNYQDYAKYLNKDMTDHVNFFDRLATDSKISLFASNALKVLFTNAKESKNAKELLNYLNKFESELSNFNLTADDTKVVLSATSTFKNSIEYWEEGGADAKKRCRWYHWICIAAIDAAGVVLGSGGGPAGMVVVGASASMLAYCCEWCNCGGGCGEC